MGDENLTVCSCSVCNGIEPCRTVDNKFVCLKCIKRTEKEKAKAKKKSVGWGDFGGDEWGRGGNDTDFFRDP